MWSILSLIKIKNTKDVINLGKLLSLWSFEYSALYWAATLRLQTHKKSPEWTPTSIICGEVCYIYQLLRSSSDINPVEEGGWNSDRTVKDAVMLKEKSVRPMAVITDKSEEELGQWKWQNMGIKGIKTGIKVKFSDPFSSLGIPEWLAFSSYPDGQERC